MLILRFPLPSFSFFTLYNFPVIILLDLLPLSCNITSMAGWFGWAEGNRQGLHSSGLWRAWQGSDNQSQTKSFCSQDCCVPGDMLVNSCRSIKPAVGILMCMDSYNGPQRGSRDREQVMYGVLGSPYIQHQRWALFTVCLCRILSGAWSQMLSFIGIKLPGMGIESEWEKNDVIMSFL